MTVIDLDVWIGKTLFVPPIIKLCQMTRQSQYAVSQLFWFATALDQLRIATTLTAQIIAGVISVLMMFPASFLALTSAFSARWFRMLALVLLMLDVGASLFSGHWRGVETWLLVLFAAYAATITNVPPAEQTGKSPALKPGEARR
ncbi:hypothetical protein [Rhizorhabdus sp. FW153]|uniref:hypothetical protein n=1 Tax=Rhizorhabdus sp. FW153 TaxID=3400216 RepID=UPI003CF2980D